MTNEAIRYTIFPVSPEAHLFGVSCAVDDPDPGGQQFSMPAWIPGSYLLREFSRHETQACNVVFGILQGCQRVYVGEKQAQVILNAVEPE